MVVPRRADLVSLLDDASCSARGPLLKVNPRSSLKTKAIPCGAAAIGSARPVTVGLIGGVDGGGVGVGVSPQHGVVGGAKEVKESAVCT